MLDGLEHLYSDPWLGPLISSLASSGAWSQDAEMDTSLQQYLATGESVLGPDIWRIAKCFHPPVSFTYCALSLTRWTAAALVPA